MAVASERSRPALLAGGAGLLAALAILTRQTVGGMTAVALPMMVCVLAAAQVLSIRRALTMLATYAVALAAVLAVFVLWLIEHSALEPFVRQVFIEGPSSKGSLAAVLLRPVVQTFDYPVFLLSCGAGLLVIVLLVYAVRGS